MYFNVLVQNILLKSKNAGSIEKRKTSFRKEIVENADLHKPVLKKIMAMQQ